MKKDKKRISKRISYLFFGEMAEWSIASDLKSDEL